MKNKKRSNGPLLIYCCKAHFRFFKRTFILTIGYICCNYYIGMIEIYIRKCKFKLKILHTNIHYITQNLPEFRDKTFLHDLKK